MNTQREIPMEEFCICIAPPVNRLFSTYVNVYENGKFNMNGRLAAILGSKSLRLNFTKDCRYLCLVEAPEDPMAILFPKSGCKELPGMAEILKGKGIAFPARFDVWCSQSGGVWYGEYHENPTSKLPAKARSTKKS